MFMIMIGGYMYIMSGGNNATMGKAKGFITDAIIGLLLAFTAYLILYVINPTLVEMRSICGNGTETSAATSGDGTNQTASTGTTGTQQPTTTTPTTTTPTTPPANTSELGSVSPECDALDSKFQSAAQNDKELACLLKGIAKKESGCNPNIGASSHGAQGLMQILPETAHMTPEQLNNPDTSLAKAVELIKNNQTQLAQYDYPTSENGISPGEATQSFPNGTGGFDTYNNNNAGTLAAYNAGGGSRISDRRLQAFSATVACRDRPGYPSGIPAWQCPYFSDGTVEGEGIHANDKNKQGYKETRDYVQKVQAAQKKCLTG